MSETFYNPNTCMGFMTYTTSRLLAAALQRHMAESGADLTAEQWGILVQLWNRGDVTQEEITRASCVDKSTVSRTMRGMERKGLIARRLDPSDTRRKIIRLTKKAETVKEKSVRSVHATLEHALRGIPPEECAACLRVLCLIKKNLQDTE